MATVTTISLTKGAVYAFEQCGLILRDARVLLLNGSYWTATALTQFAREESGRAHILFELRAEVVAGKTITTDEIRDRCADHVIKQQRSLLSITMELEGDSELKKLLQARSKSKPGTEEWNIANREVEQIDKKQRNRAPADRHAQRVRGLYVDATESGGWNRPKEVTRTEARRAWTNAANDYTVGLQKIDFTLLRGEDDHLLQELSEWKDCPQFPVLDPRPI